MFIIDPISHTYFYGTLSMGKNEIYVICKILFHITYLMFKIWYVRELRIFVQSFSLKNKWVLVTIDQQVYQQYMHSQIK